MLLRNAFIRALLPKLDQSVRVKEVKEKKWTVHDLRILGQSKTFPMNVKDRARLKPSAKNLVVADKL
jgi:hypothetical protein